MKACLGKDGQAGYIDMTKNISSKNIKERQILDIFFFSTRVAGLLRPTF
jgi:hypothetical protein